MSLDVTLYVDVDTGNDEPYRCELFSANITHNLATMASEAGIYKYLWRPEEIGIETADDLIQPLEAGLELMKNDPERFKVFDSPNGWGLYVHLVPWIEKYLAACIEHPLAKIHTWI